MLSHELAVSPLVFVPWRQSTSTTNVGWITIFNHARLQRHQMCAANVKTRSTKTSFALRQPILSSNLFNSLLFLQMLQKACFVGGKPALICRTIKRREESSETGSSG